ncbi:hypothetical protein ONZ45_g5162 [Pleurotus djamor]|nr:hypothetical protein ONZ45_g5162 [Pleurotus djamor]
MDFALKLNSKTMRAASPCASRDSMQVQPRKQLPTNDNEFMAKAARQGEVVRQLTKSNHDTFECLKVFCEKYKKQHHSIFSSGSKVYKHVFKQAGVYVATIEKSRQVAQKGVAISREATSLLESEGGKDTKAVVGIMLLHTKSALVDAKGIATHLRGIRKEIYKEMQKVDPAVIMPAHPSGVSEQPSLSVETLRTMKDEDLLRLTVMVMEQFVHAITNFVNWWASLEVDVGRLTMAIEFMLQNPNIASNVRDQWRDMEVQYLRYETEISAQQDYYDTALKDLMPESRIRKWLGKICTYLYEDMLPEHLRTEMGGMSLPIHQVLDLSVTIHQLMKKTQDSIVQHKVVIFSKSYCPYCKRAKALFSSNYPNLETKVYELDQLPDGSAIQDYLEEKTGQRTVPNIFVNRIHIGGSSDADAKHSNGELARLAAL